MANHEILFSPCQWEVLHEHVGAYFTTNNITVDSFWEGHVLESNHYKMLAADQFAGYFAINKRSTITLFHVFTPYANQAQELFARVKKYESVTNAMVPLKQISSEKGCQVLSGCWYYNHNSKKSMESAGAYSKTRLIRFYF